MKIRLVAHGELTHVESHGQGAPLGEPAARRPGRQGACRASWTKTGEDARAASARSRAHGAAAGSAVEDVETSHATRRAYVAGGAGAPGGDLSPSSKGSSESPVTLQAAPAALRRPTPEAVRSWTKVPCPAG
jgi:hypothetical protein